MLKNFKPEDAPVLQKNRYPYMSVAEIKDMITQWNQKQDGNRYFEMFAIWHNEEIVGMISMYGLLLDTISIGPEIFAEHRRNGYAKGAMEIALETAKAKGYRLVSQQIRTNNLASIALHTSLGFETDGVTYLNAKGNEVCTYKMYLV